MDIKQVKLYLRDPGHFGIMVLNDMLGPTDINCGGVVMIAKHKQLPPNIDEYDLAREIAAEGKDCFAFYEFVYGDDKQLIAIRYASFDNPFSDRRLAAKPFQMTYEANPSAESS